MNKIIACLLLTYTVFMACKVKRQIEKSSILSDNLLAMKQQDRSDNTDFHYVKNTRLDTTAFFNNHRRWGIDSIFFNDANAVKQCGATVKLYGLQMDVKKQKIVAMASSRYTDSIKKIVSVLSEENLTLHNSVHQSTGRVHIERTSKAAWWLYVVLVMMVIIGAVYWKPWTMLKQWL